MEISLLLSMSGFALAMSISPGPVNLVALGTGARYGWVAGEAGWVRLDLYRLT